MKNKRRKSKRRRNNDKEIEDGGRKWSLPEKNTQMHAQDINKSGKRLKFMRLIASTENFQHFLHIEEKAMLIRAKFQTSDKSH